MARDEKHVNDKIRELENLGLSYLIVCGEKLDHPNVVYRKPLGKYDAINFGMSLLPKDVGTVAINDVDTNIHGLGTIIKRFMCSDTALVFSRVVVKRGPQISFYSYLDAVRRKILVCASGELMIIRREVLDGILPLRPCKAEDSYILFKVLELGYKAVLCEESYVVTERTKSVENEETYKRKTVGGLYQALSYTRPPRSIRLFYSLLPLLSPLLLVLGRKGYYWMRGILLGFSDYLRGDRTGLWEPIYME